MEYTKGKLEQGSVTSWELWIGANYHIANVHGTEEIRRANAERLVTCWNEHNTLKAKADLFDDFIAKVTRLSCAELTPHNLAIELMKASTGLILQAKELTK